MYCMIIIGGFVHSLGKPKAGCRRRWIVLYIGGHLVPLKLIILSTFSNRFSLFLTAAFLHIFSDMMSVLYLGHHQVPLKLLFPPTVWSYFTGVWSCTIGLALPNEKTICRILCPATHCQSCGFVNNCSLRGS